MIYNSTITAVTESDIMSLLENAEDRFENYTMAEAVAITVSESEINWTRFMKGVGLSELSTIVEGQEIIYEGARLDKFIDKAKAFFKAILSKLAEITKSFIAKLDQFLRSNTSFIKKYESKLLKMTIPNDFEFRGYKFSNMEPPKYDHEKEGMYKAVDNMNQKDILNRKDDYDKEHAENALFDKGTKNFNSDDIFHDKLIKYFYNGEKEKVDIDKDFEIKTQLGFIKNIKQDKKNAKDSYTKSAKSVKTIISDLEKAKNKLENSASKTKSVDGSAHIDNAMGIMLNYWKTYASCAHQMHGAYCRALSTRARQAKAICTKLIIADNKGTEKGKREKYKDTLREGFVETDAFLGAVEYI